MQYYIRFNHINLSISRYGTLPVLTAVMKPILYDPATVDQYPGLEFVSPSINMSKEGWRAHVLPFTSLSSIPERFCGPEKQKLRTNVQLAYFGSWGFTHGYRVPEGISMHNGYHRTLLLYMFCGPTSYYTIEGVEGIEVLESSEKNQELCTRLDTIIEQYGLHEVVAHELRMLDEAVDYESDNSWQFLFHPLRSYHLSSTYLPRLKSHLSMPATDELPSGVTITPAHREALNRFK